MIIDGPLTRAMGLRRSIEAMVMRRCARALVCTGGVAELFRKRYGETGGSKVSVIPNGYDEADFQGLSRPARTSGSPVTFIHAGLLEQVDRDPVPFFRAVALALERGRVRRGKLKVDLVGMGNNEVYREEIRRLGLEDTIRLLPPLPYHEALAAMAAADILLLFQGPSCDAQIPAKFYEYLRIGRPILAITTLAGETGRGVVTTRSGRVVSWDDPPAMAEALGEWVENVENGKPLPACEPADAVPFSRQNQAGVLAERLATLLNPR